MYHIYALLNPAKPGKYIYGNIELQYEPYYIGMSKHEYRRFWHIDYVEPGSHKGNKILKLIKEFGKDKIRECAIKIKENLTKEEAIESEKYFISLIGRSDNNTGPLVNHTAGGEGTADLSRLPLIMRGKSISKGLIGARSIYSKTPEESAAACSASMKAFYEQNRSKTFSDLPKFKYRRFYCNDNGSQGGKRNGNAKYYYLIITPDGGYHISGLGSMRYMCSKLDIWYGAIELSATQNQKFMQSNPNKFARIMRGTAIGCYTFRFTKLSECPVNITMDNQQPRPHLPG